MLMFKYQASFQWETPNFDPRIPETIGAIIVVQKEPGNSLLLRAYTMYKSNINRKC